MATTRARRPASKMPSSRSNSQDAVLLRLQAALQFVGETRDSALQRLKLLVEIGAQALQVRPASAKSSARISSSKLVVIDFIIGVGIRDQAAGRAALAAPRLRAFRSRRPFRHRPDRPSRLAPRIASWLVLLRSAQARPSASSPSLSIIACAIWLFVFAAPSSASSSRSSSALSGSSPSWSA